MYVDRRQRVRLAKEAAESTSDEEQRRADGFNAFHGRALSDEVSRDVKLPHLSFLEHRFPWERG